MTMPGRGFQAGKYRYGFNGKEDDNDINDGGQDYGMRIYDGRLGKFLSVDPITDKYPELTPYQFASNRPIDGIDQDGLEFCRYDCDSYDPNVKLMAEWGGNKYNYRDSKYYKTFDEARYRASGSGGITEGMLWALGEGAFARLGGWLWGLSKATKPVLAIIKVGEPIALKAEQALGYINNLFKGPINVKSLLAKAGVKDFKFIKGAASGEKTAIIGQGMERVKTVAGGVKDAEIFKPEKAAVAAWDKLVKDAGGKQLSDDVVKGTQLYKDNVKWIENVKKNGYNVIDIGADGSGKASTFYNMEKLKVYAPPK